MQDWTAALLSTLKSCLQCMMGLVGRTKKRIFRKRSHSYAAVLHSIGENGYAGNNCYLKRCIWFLNSLIHMVEKNATFRIIGKLYCFTEDIKRNKLKLQLHYCTLKKLMYTSFLILHKYLPADEPGLFLNLLPP